jgi:heptosyltransferase-1
MAQRLHRSGRVPPRPELPDNPRAILVVRLSARGDVMFATPIIRALRRRYPETHLTWVVEPAARDVVEHHPELDEVLVWDRPRWKKLLKAGRLRELWQEFTAFRETLRARRYEVALDMQGLSRSSLVTLWCGAPLRLGLGSKEGSGYVMHQVHPTGLEVQYMSADPRLFADWIGLDTSPWQLDLVLAPGLRDRARTRLDQEGVGERYILLVPFTTRPWKHWVESRWGPLARRLREELDLPVVLAGGPADRPAADRVLADAGEGVVDLVGKTSLGEAMALVAESTLVVGVDTGLTHAAHGFMRPTLCLFGPSGYTVAPTPVARMIRHDLACSPCTVRTGGPICGGDYTCMQLIREGEVVAAARELLGAVEDGGP